MAKHVFIIESLRCGLVTWIDGHHQCEGRRPMALGRGRHRVAVSRWRDRLRRSLALDNCGRAGTKERISNGSGEVRTVSGVEDTDMDGGESLVDGLRTVGAGQHLPADGADFVFHSSRQGVAARQRYSI